MNSLPQYQGFPLFYVIITKIFIARKNYLAREYQFYRNRLRRARALLDFDGHDDNELGFRKNDVITVNSY